MTKNLGSAVRELSDTALSNAIHGQLSQYDTWSNGDRGRKHHRRFTAFFVPSYILLANLPLKFTECERSNPIIWIHLKVRHCDVGRGEAYLLILS
eukprot:936992-Amorphochlora_amoeboformis.AAC.2